MTLKCEHSLTILSISVLISLVLVYSPNQQSLSVKKVQLIKGVVLLIVNLRTDLDKMMDSQESPW